MAAPSFLPNASGCEDEDDYYGEQQDNYGDEADYYGNETGFPNGAPF